MFRTTLTRLASRQALVMPSLARRSLATGGAALAKLRSATPHMDVVRYEFKNRTWSLNHVDYYSEALAIGFIDGGLVPGDVVLSWLPAHFSEQVSEFNCRRSAT